MKENESSFTVLIISQLKLVTDDLSSPARTSQTVRHSKGVVFFLPQFQDCGSSYIERDKEISDQIREVRRRRSTHVQRAILIEQVSCPSGAHNFPRAKT